MRKYNGFLGYRDFIINFNSLERTAGLKGCHKVYSGLVQVLKENIIKNYFHDFYYLI